MFQERSRGGVEEPEPANPGAAAPERGRSTRGGRAQGAAQDGGGNARHHQARSH